MIIQANSATAPAMNGLTPGASPNPTLSTCELPVRPTDDQHSAQALRDRDAGADARDLADERQAMNDASAATGIPE